MKVGVYIGRFQPFHLGHMTVLSKALEEFDHVVIGIGSVGIAPTIKNPWSFSERTTMLRGSLSPEANKKISIIGLEDIPYDDALWGVTAQGLFNKVFSILPGRPVEVSLVCPRKDASSYYLDMFPNWDKFEVQVKENPINATEIRDSYFSGFVWGKAYGLIPPAVQQMLVTWRHTTEAKRIMEEWRAVEQVKTSWSSAPYPVTVNCADAVILHEGHVVVIERKGAIGNGLLALPGGHLDPEDVSLEDTALRELKEETGLDLRHTYHYEPEFKVFDHPDRSVSVRNISTAFCFNLDILPYEEYTLKAGDDAANAYWLPIGLLPVLKHRFHDDHYEIIEYFLNLKNLRENVAPPLLPDDWDKTLYPLTRDDFY